MKLAKFLRWTLLALGCLVGCAVIAIAATLWRNGRPSDAARELLAVHAARAAAPATQNAFFYLWGIAAPADAEPLDLGRRRVAWLQSHFEDPATGERDPGAGLGSASESRSPSMRELEEACSSGASTPCTLAFDRCVSAPPPDDLEQLRLARYRELLQYPRWFEAVPFDADVPIAPFDHALEGQRMLLVELARLAQRGEATLVADGLARDLDFWREVQRDADTLISKMIALAALRQHFYFGNRILRRLPPDAMAGAIPAGWRRAFDADELSMLRVFAGEFAFATRAVRFDDAADVFHDTDADLTDDFDEWDVSDRITGRVGRLLNPPQRSLNRLAAVYLTAAREFRAPLHDYRAISDRLGRERGEFKTLRIGGYIARVATAEGLRRAALLAAELRARGVGRDAVAAAVSASDLVDPFTRKPFAWSAREYRLTFEAPRANGRQRIQVYLY